MRSQLVTSTHDIWNLSKRLLLEICRALVFTFCEIDRLEFVGDIEFLENGHHTLDAGRLDWTVDYDCHD